MALLPNGVFLANRSNPFAEKSLEVQQFVEKTLSLDSPFPVDTPEHNLYRAMLQMETAQIETVIPALLFNDQRVEFRMICEKVRKHGGFIQTIAFAKVSSNAVAANISLGGLAVSVREMVSLLLQQEIAVISEEQLYDRTTDTMNRLSAMATLFANEYRKAPGCENLHGLAIDLCPVWNFAKQSLDFFLIEVNENVYGFASFQSIDPIAWDFFAYFHPIRDAAACAYSRRMTERVTETNNYFSEDICW